MLSYFYFFRYFLSIVNAIRFRSILFRARTGSLSGRFLVVCCRCFPTRLTLLALLLFCPLSSREFLL